MTTTPTMPRVNSPSVAGRPSAASAAARANRSPSPLPPPLSPLPSLPTSPDSPASSVSSSSSSSSSSRSAGIAPPSLSAALYPPDSLKAENGGGIGPGNGPIVTVVAAESTAIGPPPLLQQPSLSLFPASSPSFSRANSLTSGPSSSQSTAPIFARQLTNITANSRPPPLVSTTSISAMGGPDWRTAVSIEDRLAQRTKIHDAYAKVCGESYEQLLNVVVAVEEELVFASAVGRMEYFRSGIDWEGRLRTKKGQLGLDKAAPITHTAPHRHAGRGENGDDAPQPSATAKRAREEPVESKGEEEERGEVEMSDSRPADETGQRSTQAKKPKS